MPRPSHPRIVGRRFGLPGRHSQNRWMISYLDVVTILLVFFILAAAKTLTPVKAEPIPPAPSTAAAPPPAAPAAAMPEPPRDELRAIFETAGIEVTREPRGLVASFPQAVIFSPGDDRISESALPLLGNLAQILENIPNRLIVVGHADAAPIHNRRFRNNWELSVARGMRVLELLSRQYHIEEARMSVSGDGSNRPAGENDTPEGRAKNRRVELVILGAAEAPEISYARPPEASLIRR